MQIFKELDKTFIVFILNTIKKLLQLFDETCNLY